MAKNKEDTGTQNPQQEPTTQETAGGPMPLPKIEEISSFAAQPHIPGHAAAAGSGTKPPLPDGVNPVPPSPEPAGANDEPGPPPNPDGPQPGVGTPPGAPPAQPMGQPPAQPATTQDAEKTFDAIVEQYNFLCETHVPKLTPKIPEKEMTLLKDRFPEMEKKKRAFYEDAIKKIVDSMKLSEEEIKMIRADAIEVMQQNNIVFTAKERLIMGLLSLAEKRVEIIVKLLISKKRLNREIKEDIIATINETGLAFTEQLSEIRKEKESLMQVIAQAKETRTTFARGSDESPIVNMNRGYDKSTLDKAEEIYSNLKVAA